MEKSLDVLKGATIHQLNMFVESGAKVVYQEQGGTVRDVPHFPLHHNEQEGKQWFMFLVEKGFITPDTELSCWLFLMGFSTSQPSEVRPIEWLKTLETARMMLYKVFADMIGAKTITKARIKELAAQCFTKQGEPLHLAKPKKEISVDADAMENFLPTISDL
ncbi:MAG: hypothetical protein IKZ48_09945 [Prevotella sp.]|nr:hypothetical protein [Prevotella sp.]